MAQDRSWDADWLAAARLVRRARKAAARRRNVGVSDAAAKGTRDAACTVPHRRDEPPSVARMGGGGWGGAAYAGWSEPLERGKGSVVGTRPSRAGLRSEIRPHAGRPLSPCRYLPALAP